MSQSSLTPTIEKHFADDLCFASVAQLRASPVWSDGFSKIWWGQIKPFEGEGFAFYSYQKIGVLKYT